MTEPITPERRERIRSAIFCELSQNQTTWGHYWVATAEELLHEVDRLSRELTTALAKIAEADDHHWMTIAVRPADGERITACGCCTYGDGAPYVWPCPTIAALRGVDVGNWRTPNVASTAKTEEADHD